MGINWILRNWFQGIAFSTAIKENKKDENPFNIFTNGIGDAGFKKHVFKFWFYSIGYYFI